MESQRKIRSISALVLSPALAPLPLHSSAFNAVPRPSPAATTAPPRPRQGQTLPQRERAHLQTVTCTGTLGSCLPSLLFSFSFSSSTRLPGPRLPSWTQDLSRLGAAPGSSSTEPASSSAANSRNPRPAPAPGRRLHPATPSLQDPGTTKPAPNPQRCPTQTTPCAASTGWASTGVAEPGHP